MSNCSSGCAAPDYQHDTHDRLVLEAKERMKKRGLDSPDDGDALALTFAAPVLTKAQRTLRRGRRRNMFEDPRPVPGPRGPLDWMR